MSNHNALQKHRHNWFVGNEILGEISFMFVKRLCINFYVTRKAYLNKSKKISWRKLSWFRWAYSKSWKKIIKCEQLISHKSLGSYLRSVIKNEVWKIFHRRLPLNRFLAKTRRLNKPTMKKFLQKNLSFEADVKL